MLERRQLLPRQREADRTVFTLERDLPRTDVSVASAGRTNQKYGRPAAPRSARPADGSARPRRARRSRASTPTATGSFESAERRNGGTHVVGEDAATSSRTASASRCAARCRSRSSPSRARARMPKGDVAAGVPSPRRPPPPLNSRLRGLDEIGGAADHRRREALERLHHLRARVTGRDLLARSNIGQRLDPSPAAACPCAPGPSPRAPPGTSPTMLESVLRHSSSSSMPALRDV